MNESEQEAEQQEADIELAIQQKQMCNDINNKLGEE